MRKLFRHANDYKSGKDWEDWDSAEDYEEGYGEDPEYGDPEYIEEYADEDTSDLEEDAYYAEETGEEEDAYYAEETEEEEDAYYAEETGEEEDTYYAEETGEEENAYYAEESGEEEDAYYAEETGEEEDAYYAEETGEEEDAYYAEESEEEEDAYYAEETEEENGAFYMDGDSYYAEGAFELNGDTYYTESNAQEEEDPYSVGKSQKGKNTRPSNGKGQRNKGGFLYKLQRGIGSMTAMDRVIACTGIGVLILALITGSVFVSSRIVDSQISDFEDVGSQLDGIAVIGEQGLLAVADAQLAKAAAATIIDEEEEKDKDNQEGYDESEYTKEVTVKMEMTSIQRDLKIKFINKKTEKLVANVPFAVTVTGPDNKSVIWSDDDMDGIIYKKDITPGSYTVAMEALTDKKYADYNISTEKQSATVKKDINYEKVDVKGEVKTESEVNAKKEDTKVNETVVESTLQDTVAWVESKVISSAYNEISKNDIPNPMTIVMGKSFLRMTENSGGTGGGETGGQTPTDPTSPSDPEPTEEPDPTPDQPLTPSESPEPTPTPTPTATPTPTPTATPTPTPTATPTPTPTATPTPTPTTPPTLAQGKVAVPATFAVSVGKEAMFQATATGFTSTIKDKDGKDVAVKIKYTASTGNGDVVTVAADPATGKITVKGVKAGTAKITVTADYDQDWLKSVGLAASKDTAGTAEIIVTVANGTISLDKTTATVFLKEPLTINATIANVSESDPSLKAVESSDNSVATAVVNKKAVTITGVKAGSATITVKYVDPATNQELTAACVVTVKANPKEDKATPLKDKNGNLVYVNDNGNYRQATHADYFTYSKFYLQGVARYTGWQTLDGKVYFFNANGDKVTGEQVIQGAKYNFASDGSLVTGNGALGIDVSKWNGTIDWNAVKNSGISYVIIRCGYRGSSQGTLIEDPKFTANIKGATAAGLKVGVYFFTQAIDEREAVEEASMVLEQVKNYKISYPIFLDVEASGGRADAISKEARTAVCKAFCATIQNAGYNAGIYANKTWLETKLDPSALSAYKIWLAQYAAAPTYKGRYDLWQYRSTGSVSGISGNVDLNLSYLGY